MAENIANNLIAFLQLKSEHKHFLAQIRHWENLKMGTDADAIWVKDFTPDQLGSATLKSIPFAKLFFLKDHLLFPKDSLLPHAKLPNLLWTPMERALPVENADYNHNFFGIDQTQTIKLTTSEEEKKATVMLMPIADANTVIVNAATVRLQAIQWMVVDHQQALFLGEPLLPLNGKTYWQNDRFILPVGFDLEFPILRSVIQRKLNLTPAQSVWYMDEDRYTLIDTNLWKPLSIASWKQTIQNLSDQ